MRHVIDKYAGLPFGYGEDCCQFAGEVIESFTGSNPMDVLKYSNERQAYRIIRQYGGLEGAMRHFLGDPYDGLKDGDVCIMNNTDGSELAGVIYNNEVVARVESGLMNYPASFANLVWCT
jgi:hypothetical protein